MDRMGGGMVGRSFAPGDGGEALGLGLGLGGSWRRISERNVSFHASKAEPSFLGVAANHFEASRGC